MKKAGFYLLSGISVVALALILAEAGIRTFEHRYGISHGYVRRQDPVSSAMAKSVRRRFELLWLTPKDKKPYPFRPPFDVFVNRGADDPQRMASIAERALEPGPGTWHAEDFLLPPELVGPSGYEVSINKLGFRDPERTFKKDPGTFRVVAFGAYATFGHGVSSENSYVRVLEQKLREKGGPKRRIEVWNGGRPGHTAIMGLARLEREYQKLKPDLLIWDYGLVDVALRWDMTTIESKKPLTAAPASFLRYAINKLCPRSQNYPIEICIRSVEYLSRVSPQDALEGWRDVYTRMIAFAKSHHLPVIMLRHFNYGIPAAEYTQISDPENKIYFVSTDREMSKRPPAEDVAAFWSQPNWTIESVMTREETEKLPVVFYLKDAVQFNSLGHKVIARLLEEKIQQAHLLSGPQLKSVD